MKIKIIFSLMIAILTLSPVSNGMPSSETGLTRENLKKDISILKEQLPIKHTKIDHTIPLVEFKNSLDQLYNYADAKDEDQIIIELAKAVAAIGDGHTTVHLLDFMDEFLPINTYIFADGFFITSARKGYEDLIGKQILKVNDLDINEVYERIKPLIAHENDHWVRYQFPNYFSCYNILKYLGIAPDKTIKLTVKDGTGTLERDLTIISLEIARQKDQLRFFYDQFQVFPSLADKYRNRNYWYEYLEKYQAIYFQYNACKETKEQSMNSFSRELFGTIKKLKAKNIILDLRYNSGGDSGLFSKKIYPQLRKLRNVKIFFITGRKTFSSGLFAIRELISIPGSLSFGEPTGNSPNHYGYTGYLRLPNTGINVTYSTRYWDIFPNNHANTFTPEVMVEIDSKSFFRGEDLVTQKIFEYIMKSNNEKTK